MDLMPPITEGHLSNMDRIIRWRLLQVFKHNFVVQRSQHFKTPVIGSQNDSDDWSHLWVVLNCNKS